MDEKKKKIVLLSIISVVVLLIVGGIFALMLSQRASTTAVVATTKSTTTTVIEVTASSANVKSSAVAVDIIKDSLEKPHKSISEEELKKVIADVENGYKEFGVVKNISDLKGSFKHSESYILTELFLLAKEGYVLGDFKGYESKMDKIYQITFELRKESNPIRYSAYYDVASKGLVISHVDGTALSIGPDKPLEATTTVSSSSTSSSTSSAS